MISTKAHLRRRILCHVHYYVGQCYCQSYAQLSPALWLRRVRPLLHRTVLCHGFVRSYGCAQFYGSVVPRRPSLWIYGMTSLDPMSSRKCGVQYYGSMDLWYVWSYPMSGSMVCLVYPASPSTMDQWYVWSYPMPPPAGVGLLRISPNHINARLKCECVVHTAAYSAPARRRGAPAGSGPDRGHPHFRV
jgi:hypothetical protein